MKKNNKHIQENDGFNRNRLYCILWSDIIHDLSPIVDDGTYFDLDDFILGTTMIGSLLYTTIRIIERIFRKEDKEKS